MPKNAKGFDPYDRQDKDFGQEKAGGNQNPEQNQFNRSQKIAAGLLAFFAVLILVMWAIQFRRSITEPFQNREPAGQVGQNRTLGEDEQTLREKDTDTDGLSDWEELNIYQTSPYLEDSDSDGKTDQEEVKRGTDPNCPEGRDCGNQAIEGNELPTDDNGSLNTLLEQFDYETGRQDTSASGLEQSGLDTILSDEPDAESLRRLLVDHGMDEEFLGQISDEDLLDTFKEVMGEE